MIDAYNKKDFNSFGKKLQELNEPEMSEDDIENNMDVILYEILFKVPRDDYFFDSFKEVIFINNFALSENEIRYGISLCL